MPVAAFKNGILQRTMIAELERAKATQAVFSIDAYNAAFKLLGDVERDMRINEVFE